MASNIISMINELTNHSDDLSHSIGKIHGYLDGLLDAGVLTKTEYSDYRELADKQVRLNHFTTHTLVTSVYS